MSEKKSSEAEKKAMREAGTNESPYRLRDHSKPPSRYRDYVDEDNLKESKNSSFKQKK